MRLSVVIPTHNRAAQLPRTLRAALVDPEVAEVIVVLDGCTDDSAAVVRDLAGADARVRSAALSPNVGPSAARLHGVELAAHEAVLCLDDDVILEPGAAAGHLRHHAHDDAEVVVGYMPVLPTLAVGAVGRRYASIYDDQAREWSDDPTTILTFLWGGNVSYRTADYLEAAGRCDMSLRFHEDQEVGLVLRGMGRRALFDRDLRSAHLYERGVAATRRDQSRAGSAYAALLARYPGMLPGADEVFEKEGRLARRSLVRAAGAAPVARSLAAAVTLADRNRAGTAVASGLLNLLTRAEYYRGFHGATRSTAARPTVRARR